MYLSEEYTMILTKTGFEKFRREYDARSFDHHINGFPSDEDQENPSEEDDVDYIQTAGGAAAAKALSNLPSQLLNIQEAITAFQEGEEDNTAANE
jgi:hypothetical protein